MVVELTQKGLEGLENTRDHAYFHVNPVDPAKCCLEGESRHTERKRVPGDPTIKGTHSDPEPGHSGTLSKLRHQSGEGKEQRQ